MAKVKTLSIQDSKAPHTGMDEQSRNRVAQKLATVLADTYNLYLKTQYYHWNVTGPYFVGLHQTFETQYTALAAANDELAERIRALGIFTPGTYREFAELGRIKEDNSLPGSWKKMVQNLIDDNETCSRIARETLEVAEDAGDEVTVDMMVARMTYHEKQAWMLRSILE